MSRQQRFRRGLPPNEVAAAARRRLALLEQELTRSGLVPSRPRILGALDPDDFEALDCDDLDADDVDPDDLDPDGAGPVAVARRLPEPGRHSRAREVGARGPSTPGTATAVRGWLGDRLPGGWGGRVRLTSAHLAVAALVVGVALAVAAVAALRSAGSGEAVPLVHGPAGAATSPLVSASPVPSAAAVAASSGGSSVTASAGGPGEGTSAGATVVVDVAGKVRRPGVATLPAGSRVVDALERAGGARAGVSLTALNLARPLVDGEQILVGVRAAPGVAASAAAAPGTAGVAVPGALVDLNTATAEQLDTLPGVGPVTAQKILAWRDQHGGFSSVDELTEVDGIGDKKLADLAPLLTL